MFLTENKCFGFELTLCKCVKDEHLPQSKIFLTPFQLQRWRLCVHDSFLFQLQMVPWPPSHLQELPDFFKWVSSPQLPAIKETGSVFSSGFAIHTMLCGCENQSGCWSRNISWAHLIHMKTSQVATTILHLTEMCFPQAVSHRVNSCLVLIL